MSKSKIIREYLRATMKYITPGLWGRYGYWENGKQPQPHKGSMEAAPGLTIGTTGHTEPIARFSGYGHDVSINADYVTVLVNSAKDLLDDIDSLELENELLREKISRIKSGNDITS